MLMFKHNNNDVMFECYKQSTINVEKVFCSVVSCKTDNKSCIQIKIRSTNIYS